MKFEADVKTALEFSRPESVEMLTAAASVRAPPKTWTVSKPFSVSNSENCENSNKPRYFLHTNKNGYRFVIRLMISQMLTIYVMFIFHIRKSLIRKQFFHPY